MMIFTMLPRSKSQNQKTNRAPKEKQTLRAVTSANTNRSSPVATPRVIDDMNRNQEVGFFTDFTSYGQEEPLALEINMRNLENLTLLDNFNSVNGMNGIENNENLAFFPDYEGQCNTPFFPTDGDDSKEPNVSRTVKVPTSEHVAEIVGRQGCKIKDLRARTNTYIKTPMRTEPPIFVVTGKETAVNVVITEINSAAEHFTQIRASRNHHKNGGGSVGGGEVAKPVTREGDVVLHVTVPYRVVGLVVGLKGQTIKQIQQDTDTFIVTPNRDKAPIFEIRGQPSNVERARVMIERHIEVRTRNCRLQDTTNLQNCDEPRFGNNEYHYSYSDTSSPPNGNSNHLSNNYISNSNNSHTNNALHSPNNYNNLSSPHPSSSSGNYNSWRSYSGLLGESVNSNQSNNPIQTWSSATSEYSHVVGNGHASNSMRNNGTMQYSNMSVGSMSSNSNGSVSASPPQDFLGSGSFSNRQLQCPMGGTNGGSNRLGGLDSIGDGHSSFSSYPLFSTSSTTPTKSSLVLGNIMQQSGVNGSSGSNRDMTNGFGGRNHASDVIGFSSPSADIFRGGYAADHNIFGQMGTPDLSGFPSGESSPASKSCSLSESSGSQGSPTPRMCKVCEEADVVAALVPCGHNHFCMECAENIVNKPGDVERKCPICHHAVVDMLRILA